MPGEGCADRACDGLLGQALWQSSLLAALSAVLTTVAEPNTWTETAYVFAGMFCFQNQTVSCWDGVSFSVQMER